MRPGGSDRVVNSLLKLYPSAEVFTAVYDEDQYSYLSGRTVNTSFIQKMPFIRSLYRHYNILFPLAFEQFDFSEFDLVVSLSAGSAKGVVTQPGTLHLGIVFTPPRFQWGGKVNIRASRLRKLLKLLVPFADSYLRLWDFEASRRPDVLASISRFIQDRVRKVYGRNSYLLYPGVNLNFWHKDRSIKKRKDYYLVVARLYDYKRVDLAIQACKKLGRSLKIIGEGPDEAHLRKIAGKNVEFLGFLADEECRKYMSECRAFIFAGVDDFGLTSVEAMACGAPVIAYNKGGAAEVVVDSETGVFFDQPTRESLCSAILRFESMFFDEKIVTGRAEHFSEEKFTKDFKQIVENELRTG